MKQEILKNLPGAHPWQDRIHWYRTTDSTNTQAKLLAAQGAPHGTVVIAEEQSAGRGRLGRSFVSPEGMGVYVSFLLRYPCPPQELVHLTCAAAVAVCDAVELACGFRPGIKWTNDLVWNGKKLGGILTELVTGPEQTAAIVGIGLNCSQTRQDFPEELQDMAASLSMVTGDPVHRERLISFLIRALYDMDLHLLSHRELLLSLYQDDCITLGKQISLHLPNGVRHGKALELLPDGSLLVAFENGTTEPVNSGEVSIRGMYGYV